MENQINIGDQNTEQIGQNPSNQPVRIPEKLKVNYWMFLTIIFALLFLGTLSLNIIINSQKKQVDKSNTIPTQQSKNPPNPTTFLSPSTSKSLEEVECNTSISDEDMMISKSSRDGYCWIFVPLNDYKTTGYRLEYPADWTVRIAGAAGMNLFFNEGKASDKKWELFIQLTTTELPLEQADKATYSYEISGPDPLVSPEEVLQSRKIETIGDKQVLNLITSKGDIYINRYFLIQKDKGKEYTTLYMFKTETPKSVYQDTNYVNFLTIVLDMIISMKFAN